MKKALIALLIFVFMFSVAAAQDAIKLNDFADDAFGFSTVVPEGWTAKGNGIYARASSPTDFTLIAQQAVPLAVDKLWPSLLPQLALTDVPDSAGTYESPTLNWTLYKVDVKAGAATIAVDMALAEADGKTYIVLLQTTPDDYQALHNAVFQPTLAALAPIVEAVTDVPYQQEEVTVPNGDVTLAGTLTLPEGDGPHPAVVLVTGSGPQDRDESLAPAAAIKPFRLIADALTRAGIAVLRYDDRGIGKSTGDFASATTPDFASDASAAIQYLMTRSDINPKQIGVLGHSEGGEVAAMLGANDPHVAFIVSMAGPAVSGADVLLLQNKLIMQAGGAGDEQIQLQLDFLQQAFGLMEKGDTEAIQKLAEETARQQFDMLTDEQRKTAGSIEEAVANAQQGAASLMTPWFKYFVNYNPGEDWAKTTVPVLALFGGKDTQVDGGQNAPAMEAALKQAGNTDYSIVTLPDANHLFQSATSGAPSEYGTLKQEFTADFLPTVVDWVLKHVTVAQ
ncbi:MAG: alpha/beta fold hydrolase [Anaerolineae bacterium]